MCHIQSYDIEFHPYFIAFINFLFQRLSFFAGFMREFSYHYGTPISQGHLPPLNE
ncbi:hypothetical protein TMU01_18950 [Tenuibacillus multivorans]|uniref:Uncharacterized protein n=1 Tax=Tenuibacillus multivorans TaxID=237069 RepID=A0A1H0FGV0_9BACI|nr:hypothetical protein TMU01_18950 [Tenuibacillus multivorans]SDN93895.1 hypothetical protein SAMN05216498_0249 [Tenuibacillus multivorans]